MTTHTIEVRANAEQYDLLAQQVAREILQLFHTSGHEAAGRDSTALTVSTAHLYHLSGSLTTSDIEQLTRQLFIDPVTQQATIDPSLHQRQAGHIVDVFFHAGVTDTLAESVLTGAAMLGISGLERVETGHRYFLDARLNEEQVRQITEALLYNPVIQDYTLNAAPAVGVQFIAPASPSSHIDERHRSGIRADTSAMGGTPEQADTSAVGAINRPLRGGEAVSALLGMSDEQLLDVSKRGMLALNLDEMRAIQRYYRELGREPTDVELETLAQTWSEHCSHKTFKALIDYREVDSDGNVLEAETIEGLLKQYIMRATQQLAHPWVVSAFGDNAGIVRFTEEQDIAFKVETHNHPSAIEPFGGANTGVGGVIRDVLGVSAQPIACTDILCFGPPDTPGESLPAGVLTPHRIASGVVNGVRDYGNKMGIPTVNGAVLYHPGYIYNPLVFCGCLGMLPHGSHPRHVQPGDRIVVLGGYTGRDGIHGATFSSGEMSSEIHAQAGSAVQIGAPITEKKVSDVIVQARDLGLYSAITDCGAGGFSSAIGEMGAETGAFVELEKAPLKYQGLKPWEIWLSEAQERMVLAVPPERLPALLDLCALEEVAASIIGVFTDTRRLVITYAGQTVADLDMAFLHDGRPGRRLDAVWVKNDMPQNGNAGAINQAPTRALRGWAGAINQAPTLLGLLRHPTIASKESIVRRYDHEVQGATVLKPLVGRVGNGPGDAAVLQPLLDEETSAGIVLSNGINPMYGTIDPYWMALNAVDEALRNLTAVGGDIERAAILDNFCWGNPNDSAQLGLLVRAVKGCCDAALGFGTPFISGKDSLNNEYRAAGQRLPVISTLLISAVGVIDDASQTVDMSLKQPGNLLYLVGATRNELAGSHILEVTGSTGQMIPGTGVPRVDLETARTTMKAVGKAIREGLAQACHDLSEGGLAVAAAEMSLASLLGLSLDISRVPLVEDDLSRDEASIVRLFSESPSRFLLEIAPEQRATFETTMREQGVHDVYMIGNVTNTERFEVSNGSDVCIDLPVSELQLAWKGGQA